MEGGSPMKRTRVAMRASSEPVTVQSLTDLRGRGVGHGVPVRVELFKIEVGEIRQADTKKAGSLFAARK